MHSIILATAKLNYEANGNTSHNQSFDMSRRRQSFGTSSEMSFGEKPSSRLSSRPSSSLLLDTQIIPGEYNYVEVYPIYVGQKNVEHLEPSSYLLL